MRAVVDVLEYVEYLSIPLSRASFDVLFSDANEAEVTHEVDARPVGSRSGLGWVAGLQAVLEPAPRFAVREVARPPARAVGDVH
ncbi:hypothetical protein TUM20983_40790 [Mycobacterium antarcticum]|nr:hypothetical protein TUM20983_40790 [Mycolicibacterium sp. TUM20983]